MDTSSTDDPIRQKIESLIGDNKVMLFMKGSKMFPMCGFSGAVIDVLKRHGTKFETFNVLSDDAIRSGIKAYAQWPTIPQLYVDGEFVGGCDIIREMDESGELATLLAKSQS